MNCIPPWLASRNQCNANITTYGTIEEIRNEVANKFILPKFFRRLTDVETTCLRNKTPCKKMKNMVSVLFDEETSGNAIGETNFGFSFKKTVTVEKKVVVYTWFNFIVDVGSSLGLWLGLSALSTTDFAIEAFMMTKQWLSVNIYHDSNVAQKMYG